MKIKYELYHIGFLTNLFDVSRDTIRLYEKKGLLSSQKEKDSGYRVFYRDDVFNMDYVKRLREMQFSLDDIGMIIRVENLSQTIERTDAKLAELNAQIENLCLIREQMINYAASLKEAESEKLMIELTEPISILAMDIQDSLWKNMEYLRTLDRSLSPAMTITSNRQAQFLVNDFDILLKDSYRENTEILITCVDRKEIRMRDDFPKEQIRAFPERQYLKAIVKTEKGRNYEQVGKMVQYAGDNGFDIKGHSLARYMFSRRIHQVPIDYYEFWLPIVNRN